MSAQHTPGRQRKEKPAVANGNGVHIGTRCLATTHAFDPQQRQDEARRLAACWNACEGIETEALERNSLGVVGAEASRVAEHRAKMVEAIRELIEAETKYREARGGPWVYKNVPHQIQHRLQLAWQSVHNVIDKA